MSRFDNLEFEESEVRRTPEPQSELERDEHYWLKLADDNRRSGFHENALRYYSRALEVDKSIVSGWLGQVQMLIALDEYPEADLWGKKALELFRENGDLLAGRAQALIRMGDQRGAGELCDAAMQRAGPSAYPWLVRGEIMVAGRETIDHHCFDKAVALAQDWLTPLEIARIYLHYKRPSQAVAWAGKAVAKAPEQPYAWYVKGSCELNLNLETTARQSFKRCLELVPNHSDAQRRLTELTVRPWSVGRILGRLLGR
ncbi:MAG: hypothetical protein HY040_14375 [Planctomycetes bacterium]|nr:hypothetical protein [Planctomycetota bacterium]